MYTTREYNAGDVLGYYTGLIINVKKLPEDTANYVLRKCEDSANHLLRYGQERIIDAREFHRGSKKGSIFRYAEFTDNENLANAKLQSFKSKREEGQVCLKVTATRKIPGKKDDKVKIIMLRPIISRKTRRTRAKNFESFPARAPVSSKKSPINMRSPERTPNPHWNTRKPPPARAPPRAPVSSRPSPIRMRSLSSPERTPNPHRNARKPPPAPTPPRAPVSSRTRAGFKYKSSPSPPRAAMAAPRTNPRAPPWVNPPRAAMAAPPWVNPRAAKVAPSRVNPPRAVKVAPRTNPRAPPWVNPRAAMAAPPWVNPRAVKVAPSRVNPPRAVKVAPPWVNPPRLFG